MKKITCWVSFCCVLAIITLVKISSAQSTTTDITTLQQQLNAEIKNLRVEVLQQGIAFQEWKINQLEREFQRIKSERERWEESEQTIRRQIAEVEQSIAAGGGGEQEGMKTKLTGTRLRDVQTKNQPLLEQETELQKQLAQERQQLQLLQNKLKQVKE